MRPSATQSSYNLIDDLTLSGSLAFGLDFLLQTPRLMHYRPQIFIFREANVG